MTILISIPAMSSGGAERVTSILCNGLVQYGHRVVLVTDSINHKVFYRVDSRVEIIPLPYSVSGGFFKRKLYCLKYIYKLRKVLSVIKPDFFVSVLYVTFIRSFLAKIGMRLEFIISDHTSFDRYNSIYTKFIRFHLYSLANKVTILSKKDLKIIDGRLKNAFVVYNPSSFHPLLKLPPKKNSILCAGRLDVWSVKGFDIMFQIWARICRKYPNWILQIAGTGSESSLKLLKKQLDNLNISNNVIFLGQVEDMQTLLSSTSIFALPSRTEGFPMVLLEAMSQGCACISFSLKNVVQEIFLLDKSGIIVEDGNIDNFAIQLSNLIDNERERSLIGTNAIATIRNFSIEKYLESWNQLLNN